MLCPDQASRSQPYQPTLFATSRMPLLYSGQLRYHLRTASEVSFLRGSSRGQWQCQCYCQRLPRGQDQAQELCSYQSRCADYRHGSPRLVTKAGQRSGDHHSSCQPQNHHATGRGPIDPHRYLVVEDRRRIARRNRTGRSYHPQGRRTMGTVPIRGRRRIVRT